MSETAIAPEVRRFYSERMDRAASEHSEVERLCSAAHSLLENHERMDTGIPARYERSHGGHNILGPERPGEFGHWTTSYLRALGEPEYGNVYRALDDIALQSADPDGGHRPEDAALFTAAARILVPVAFAHCSQPEWIDDVTEGLSMVSLADGLVRAQVPLNSDDDTWRPFLKRAARLAVAEAMAEPYGDSPRRPSTRNHHDELGRHIYIVEPLGAILRARRIFNYALAAGAMQSNDPNLVKFRDHAAAAEPTLRDESARLCTFGLVATSMNYHLAVGSDMDHEQVQALGQLAWQLHDRHTQRLEAGGKSPDPLTMPAMPTGRALADEDQRSLMIDLERFSRAYNPWFDRMVNFDDYGQPGSKQFERLDLAHSEQMVRYARIILSAGQLTLSELAPRRDAMMLTACGNINWQTREEFDSFLRHRGPIKAVSEGALERLDTASAIIAAMPDAVVSEQQREVVLLHDRNRRRAMQVLAGELDS